MAEKNFQRIRHTDQLIFNENNDLIGIQNPKAQGEDFLPVRLSSDGTSLVDGAGNAFLRGALTSGEWTTIPSIFRLRLTGTGTVVMDSRDSLSVSTLAVESYTVSGATDQIEYPYAGDNAVAIRVTLTGTAAAEVI